ncbi:MAG: MATE family efflux transporter [Alphaproteobacteria bacterium]|nr:MATE family efflux transporter [Alphaproteobacteria bacterium]
MPVEPRWLAARLRRHLTELARLAAPVVVTRAGILTMAAVDAAMLGRTTVDQVAFHGLGVAPFVVITVTGIGLLFGTVVMTSHAVGREQYSECGPVWRRSLPYALLLGLIALVFCLFGTPFFQLTGQSPEIATGAGSVIAILGLGAPGTLLFNTTAFFLEGLRRPLPAMIIMIAANGVNVLLNWVLIFGEAGLPALGADGAALSTTIVRTAMAAALIAYVWWMRDRDRYAVRPSLGRGWWRTGARHRRIGFAAGASYGIESVAFGAISFYAGILGALALASYTLQHIVFAMIFMVALGIASATSVRVGIAHGRGDWADRALAGWTGLGLVAVLLGACGAVLLGWPEAIAAIFTSEPSLIAATAPLIALSAYALIADGGQMVVASALRGAGETWMPTAMHVVSYVCVMMPACWIFAFPMGYGALGLVAGIIVASVVSVTLLSIRFWLVARR